MPRAAVVQVHVAESSGVIYLIIRPSDMRTAKDVSMLMYVLKWFETLFLFPFIQSAMLHWKPFDGRS